MNFQWPLSVTRGVRAAAVPRIWEDADTVRGFGSLATMGCTRVTHEDGLLLNDMAALAMAGTGIDGVLVVEAPADGVAFDDLVAHLE